MSRFIRQISVFTCRKFTLRDREKYTSSHPVPLKNYAIPSISLRRNNLQSNNNRSTPPVLFPHPPDTPTKTPSRITGLRQNVVAPGGDLHSVIPLCEHLSHPPPPFTKSPPTARECFAFTIQNSLLARVQIPATPPLLQFHVKIRYLLPAFPLPLIEQNPLPDTMMDGRLKTYSVMKVQNG